MDSAIEEVLKDQASPQDYDDESSFEVISDSDDPVSPETDRSTPAKPIDPETGNAASSSLVDLAGSECAGKNVQAAPPKLVTYHSTPAKLVAETPAPAPMPDPKTGNASSSSLVVLAGTGSADKNVLSAPAELVALVEIMAPASTPDPETGNAASSSVVVLAGSGSAANNVQAAPAEIVPETTAPAPRPDRETGNAVSSSLAVLAGSGSADNNFQDENSLVIGQSDEEYRERDQRRAENFSAHNCFEREREINNDPDVKDLDFNPYLLFRRYLSCPELGNHSDSDDSDCSIDIIDEQNEVKLNNVTYFSDSENFVALQ